MTMMGTHDPWLVALSILIAMLASYAALDIADRMRASTGVLWQMWLGAAAIAMGGGIWSMHFVAMLAFRMPAMGVSYESSLTLLSLILAVCVTGIGFGVMRRWEGSLVRLGAAGLFMGWGIVAMHYVGMAAMRMPARIVYDPAWVALSIVIAIGAATTALWLATRDSRPLHRALAAGVMGIAIAGMHYAGMAGASFLPIDHGEVAFAPGVSRASLVALVTTSTLLILFLTLVAATFDRRLSIANRLGERAALRLHLADVMRDETTDDALRRASALMGHHFAVSRVGFAYFDPIDNSFDHAVCWTDGRVPMLHGRRSARVFGLKLAAELHAGRTVRIDDLLTSPLSDEPTIHSAAVETDTRATLIVPFVREGRLRTILYLNDSHYRRWTADEVRFVEEVAERTRQAVSRAETEEDLRRLNATLEARIEERTAQLQEAEAALRQSQKMEAIGQLTGGIAHDFNNMLTGVIGNLELIRRRVSEGRGQEIGRFIDQASAAAERAAALTARLLAFSRRQPLDNRSTDVGRLIRALDDLLRTTLGDAIDRAILAPPETVHAMVDPYQLENAILNLAINARDAMPHGGTLTVAIGTTVIDGEAQPGFDLPSGRYATVAVVDTGVGMPAALVERVVEPFFTTKPLGQGTGLGLSMVYGFARQSGGQVRIDSREGRGTTVTILLPAADESERLVEHRKVPAAAGRGQAVLLVEDDEQVRPIIHQLLEELGYAPVAVANAQAAIPILTSDQTLDLMISDVGLPGMNGRELAEIARVQRPDLPILFLTGYAEAAADRNAFLGEGMALMTKPFEFDALAAKVGEMLARS